MLQPHRKVSCFTSFYTKKSGKWLLFLQRFFQSGIASLGFLQQPNGIIHHNCELFITRTKKPQSFFYALRLFGLIFCRIKVTFTYAKVHLSFQDFLEEVIPLIVDKKIDRYRYDKDLQMIIQKSASVSDMSE